MGPRVGGQCGVAGLGVGEGGHSLVLTLTSADSVPPVSVALYDLWADEWSRPGPDRHRDKSRSTDFYKMNYFYQLNYFFRKMLVL